MTRSPKQEAFLKLYCTILLPNLAQGRPLTAPRHPAQTHLIPSEYLPTPLGLSALQSPWPLYEPASNRDPSNCSRPQKQTVFMHEPRFPWWVFSSFPSGVFSYPLHAKSPCATLRRCHLFYHNFAESKPLFFVSTGSHHNTE